MLEAVQFFFSSVLLLVVGFVVWQSFKLVDEKKERQRKGLTDYYDNPIERKDT